MNEGKHSLGTWAGAEDKSGGEIERLQKQLDEFVYAENNPGYVSEAERLQARVELLEKDLQKILGWSQIDPLSALPLRHVIEEIKKISVSALQEQHSDD